MSLLERPGRYYSARFVATQYVGEWVAPPFGRLRTRLDAYVLVHQCTEVEDHPTTAVTPMEQSVILKPVVIGARQPTVCMNCQRSHLSRGSEALVILEVHFHRRPRATKHYVWVVNVVIIFPVAKTLYFHNARCVVVNVVVIFPCRLSCRTSCISTR